MAREKKPPKIDEDVVPGWMGTYGDMITLVLTLFVLLFSFSSIDAQKWDKIISSLSGTPFISIQALDPYRVGPAARLDEDVATDEDLEMEEMEDIDRTDTTPPPDTQEGINIKEQFDELFLEIQQHIETNNLEMKLNVEKVDDFIVLHITDITLFDSGKADVKPEAEVMLLNVADIFTEYDPVIKMIRIEGHTDNVPINTYQFKSNWELSIARAANVLRFFLDTSKITPGKYSASGYGEYHPVATNETEEGKAQNRRVDFLIESIEAED